MSAVLALARGDFLERVRRHGFLVTLAITVWAARAALPPVGSSYVTVRVGEHRALYNSAGVGSMVAMLTGIFLTLIGFYLVKGAVERDRASGVGQILGATRLSRLAYVLSKVASNLAVLAVIAAVMLVVAGLMQLVLGEDRRIDLVALATPFVLLTLPTLLLVSAVAVLFEMVPALRGGLGNVAYFLLFTFGMAAGVPQGVPLPIGDAAGLRIVMPSLERACAARYPDFKVGSGDLSVGINVSPHTKRITPFTWSGVRWTPQAVGWRLAWAAIALAFALLAAALFDRFDGARLAPAKAPWWSRFARAPAAATEGAGAVTPSRVSVAALAPAARAERFAPLLVAEVRLMLQGVSRWWFAVALALAVLCLALPLSGARTAAACAALWPILLWSPAGSREKRSGVDALLFSAPRPLRRQLLAAWLAGVLLALAATGAYALRLALAGDLAGLAGWLGGVAFVPSFALAAGVWTGSGKLFEIAYLVLWYIGPLNHVPDLDYLGTTPGAGALAPAAWLTIACALLALAYAGRARQVRG